MKHDSLQLLKLFQDTKSPMTETEVATRLKLCGAARKRLQKSLRGLVLSGEIVKIRGNRYSVGQEADLVTGHLSIGRSGNGFVKATSGDVTVFVSKQDQSTALPRDLVIVRLNTDAGKSTERPQRRGRGKKGPARRDCASDRLSGNVIRVLERSRRDIVGTLQSTGRFLNVIPIDPSYAKNFYVPEDKGARINDRVVIRFTNWENKHVSPEAEIVDVIGPINKPSVDTQSIIRHFGLKEDFEPEVITEAENCSVMMDNPGRRLDLRNKMVITIDPDEAKDFDDALSLEADKDGNLVLGIHIADVSHFVRPKSKLDIEALRRGNSVYLPDKVIPMLPEQLSNGMCSLRPDEDRLAFTALLTVDKAGNVKSRRFAKTVIRSKLRLTYKKAMAMIDNRDNTSPGQLVRELHALAQRFRRKRFAKHALSMDIAECKIKLDRKGRMTDVELIRTDPSHQLVEECMIAANEAVATELANKGISLISRFHDKPDKDKIENLASELTAMGYKPGDLNRQSNVSAFLTLIEDDPLAYHIRIAVLRSMKRAEYSALKHGHYGLAKKFYAHFTSPIRRYPDLILHRILETSLLGKAERRGDSTTLTSIAAHCSLTEQVADDAERSLIEIKKYRFLAAQLKGKNPLPYKAVVTAVMNFGMFVEVLNLQLQGLVHVSSISNSFVRFSDRNRSLKAGNKTYKLGMKVQVHVTKVDIDKRQIDFILC